MPDPDPKRCGDEADDLPDSGSEDDEPVQQECLDARDIRELAFTDGNLPSPIDINIVKVRPVNLKLLLWKNFEKMPKKMKITNSGQTVILSAKWNCERPYIAGGPLDGKYVFSQLHFHWGKSALEGSEHTIEETRYPLEAHALLFKSKYLNQSNALKYRDGVITLAYLYQIRTNHSPVIHQIVSQLNQIRQADCSVSIEPFIVTDLMYPFESDYYAYWGTVNSRDSCHTILWLVCREVGCLSYEQLRFFRQLNDANNKPINRNWHPTHAVGGRTVFHCNPHTIHTNSTLAPVPLRLDKDRILHSIEFYQNLEECKIGNESGSKHVDGHFCPELVSGASSERFTTASIKNESQLSGGSRVSGPCSQKSSGESKCHPECKDKKRSKNSKLSSTIKHYDYY